jgi:hypothetical protein
MYVMRSRRTGVSPCTPRRIVSFETLLASSRIGGPGRSYRRIWRPRMRASDCPNRAAGAGRGHRGRTTGFLAAAALVVVALAGCKERPKQPVTQQAPPPDLAAKAVTAAQEAVAAGVRASGEAKFRAVQTWRQAMPRPVAVCGQVNPKGSATDPFVPFVAVIEFGGGSDPSPIHIEHHAATSTDEATRVYGEMVSRCLEDGGPRPLGPRHTITEPIPPMPSGLPRTEQAVAPPSGTRYAPERIPTMAPVVRTPAVTAPAVTAPAGTLVAPAVPAAPATPSAPPAPAAPPAPVATTAALQMAPGQTAVPRQNVNLHTEPQGPVSRVVPKGMALRIFGQAAGGWYLVGDTEQPWGWIHGSLLDLQ